jgi:hypothetical protein
MIVILLLIFLHNLFILFTIKIPETKRTNAKITINVVIFLFYDFITTNISNYFQIT